MVLERGMRFAFPPYGSDYRPLCVFWFGGAEYVGYKVTFQGTHVLASKQLFHTDSATKKAGPWLTLPC
jgi:hypothetical protein